MSPQIITNTKKFMVFFLFALLGLGLVSIIIPTLNSFAEEVNIDLNVDPVISLSLSNDKLGMDIVPDAVGVSGSNSTVATVSTNNVNGYTLSMATKINDPSLIHGSDNVSDKINTASAISIEKLATNRWGYSLDDASEILAIPGALSPANIKTTTEPASSSNTKILVSAKVDSSLASGRYSNTLVFSAVGNPDELPPFGGITTMQQMTTAICEAEPTPAAFLDDDVTVNPNVPSATLVDGRDGKSYTIAKLADGYCWMTQNLALGGNSPITLTSADSDVDSDYVLPAAIHTEGEDGSWGLDGPHVFQTNDESFGASYNWMAATTESLNYNQDETAIAMESVCPKGWRLPVGGNSGDFSALFSTYSLNNKHGSVLMSKPFRFALAGDYYINNFLEETREGSYWTATLNSRQRGNNMRVQGYYSSQYPNQANSVYFGYAVRCVAR